MALFVSYKPIRVSGGGGGDGTVTSVGLSDGSVTPIYGISGSPVTTSGTLTFTLESQSANTIFAGPTIGSPAQPTFRALVAADIPGGLISTSISVTSVSTNASFYPTFVSGSASGTYPLDFSSSISFNPSTGKLSTTALNLSSLTASQAVVTDGSKNLASLAYTSAATPSTIASRDISGDSSFSTLNVNVLNLKGSNSGTISVIPQADSGTYNFNPPITAGNPGEVLTSQGGSNIAMTWSAPSTGTVTSIGMTVPATIFSVSPSTITTSGTFSITASGTSGGVPYFSSASTIGSSSLLTASQLVLGGGAGTAPSVLAAGSQYVPLTMGASVPGYTALALGQTAATSGQLLVSRGGTGQDFSSSSGAIFVTSGTFSAGLLPVVDGGTGLTGGTSGGVLYFSSASTIASSGLLTSSQLVLGGGAGSAPTSLAAGSQYQVLRMGASNPGYGAVDLAQSAAVTGVLPIANGGTDNGSLAVTAGGVIYTDGTKLQNVGAGSSGNVLQSNGASAPTWVNNTPTFSSLSTNGVMFANSATTITSTLSSNTTGQALVSTSNAAPSWGALGAAGVQTSTFTAPTVQRFTSSSGTYTLPTSPRSPLYVIAEIIGAGGGGSGSGSTTPSAGSSGGNSTFGSATAGGGSPGVYTTAGGAGGTNTAAYTTIVNMAGTAGNGYSFNADSSVAPQGGGGGTGFFGGGPGDTSGLVNGISGTTNSGSGGSGGGGNGGVSGGAGGGAGGYLKLLITSPSSTYSYAIGAGGGGGGSGTGGFTGGAGSSGIVVITEYYQ